MPNKILRETQSLKDEISQLQVEKALLESEISDLETSLNKQKIRLNTMKEEVSNLRNESDHAVKRTGDTMTGNLIVGRNLIYHDNFYAYYIGYGGPLILNSTFGGGISIGEFNSSYISINTNLLFFPIKKATIDAPPYVEGGVYYDTTLHKLRIGGAAGYETITSGA